MENVNTIALWVKGKYGVDVFSRSRSKSVSEIRSCIQYVLRERGWTYPKIAKAFNCNHATVIYNTKKPLPNEIIEEIRRIAGEKSFDIPEPKKTHREKWANVFKIKPRQCEVCGFSEVVEVHHKNPAYGNVLENLMVLCPNHHALVHNGGLLISPKKA